MIHLTRAEWAWVASLVFWAGVPRLLSARLPRRWRGRAFKSSLVEIRNSDKNNKIAVAASRSPVETKGDFND